MKIKIGCDFMIFLIASCQFFTSSFQFQKALKSTVIAVSFILPAEVINSKISHATEVVVPTVTNTQPKVVSKEYVKSTTGIEYYDYTIGDGPIATFGDKVVYNYKGRLAGRQGKIFEDTFAEGVDPIRMTLGTTDCIPGLEMGFAGEKDGSMPPMKKGGKRRLVIPARLGYTTKRQLPIPSDFGERQRLYGTVLNSERGDRERAQLGDSLVGIVVLDVELLKVYPPVKK
mmetsp:Transcript_10780/g.10408  ORF Transcript_10780/g.10408 Transcript_10780/m.10408 type:complete len:229 (+) Transcript_10780:176-862(+)